MKNSMNFSFFPIKIILGRQFLFFFFAFYHRRVYLQLKSLYFFHLNKNNIRCRNLFIEFWLWLMILTDDFLIRVDNFFFIFLFFRDTKNIHSEREKKAEQTCYDFMNSIRSQKKSESGQWTMANDAREDQNKKQNKK